MNCPVCSKQMVEEDFGVKVNVCENGCKGIWFEHGALQKLDQNNEGVGQALEAALNSPRANNPNRGPIQCPVCHIPMHRHQYSRSNEANVDECYNCAGFFLDSGELSAIRNKAMTDDEVDSYVDQLIDGIPQAREQEVVKKGAMEAAQLREIAARKFGQILQKHYWGRSA